MALGGWKSAAMAKRYARINPVELHDQNRTLEELPSYDELKRIARRQSTGGVFAHLGQPEALQRVVDPPSALGRCSPVDVGTCPGRPSAISPGPAPPLPIFYPAAPVPPP